MSPSGPHAHVAAQADREGVACSRPAVPSRLPQTSPGQLGALALPAGPRGLPSLGPCSSPALPVSSYFCSCPTEPSPPPLPHPVKVQCECYPTRGPGVLSASSPEKCSISFQCGHGPTEWCGLPQGTAAQEGNVIAKTGTFPHREGYLRSRKSQDESDWSLKYLALDH